MLWGRRLLRQILMEFEDSIGDPNSQSITADATCSVHCWNRSHGRCRGWHLRLRWSWCRWTSRTFYCYRARAYLAYQIGRMLQSSTEIGSALPPSCSVQRTACNRWMIRDWLENVTSTDRSGCATNNIVSGQEIKILLLQPQGKPLFACHKHYMLVSAGTTTVSHTRRTWQATLEVNMKNWISIWYNSSCSNWVTSVCELR